ncbi:ferredoxin [Vallitalea guaymasensis]|uniref:Ferredoxin n=1 Tax=Vallitalea guaymasensis TaxID=1185412 RepID=A0A8J8MCE0_9FIRM|nr:ferredoxin [Vallitalea guaymasensis]QUH30376.1 ferredoxin [Vallitalea guaymasensis]
MKGFVDEETCIGCGLCPSICPEIFEMDNETGKAIAKDIEIADDTLEDAKDAEEQCPVEAIDIK